MLFIKINLVNLKQTQPKYAQFVYINIILNTWGKTICWGSLVEDDWTVEVDCFKFVACTSR